MTRPYKSAVEFDVEAHEHYLKGAFESNPLDAASLQTARDELQAAVDGNPLYARAHGELAYTLANMAISGWFPGLDLDATWADAMDHANRGVEIDPHDYINHWNLAYCLVNTGNGSDYDKGVERFRKAVDLFNDHTDPMDRKPGLLAEFGEILVYGGNIAEGIAMIEKATRPPDWYFWNLSFARYCAEDYNGAIAALNQMSSQPGDERFIVASLLVRGAAEAQRGDSAKAQQAVAQYEALSPSPQAAQHIVNWERTTYGFKSYHEVDKQDSNVARLAALWVDGINKAGFVK